MSRVGADQMSGLGHLTAMAGFGSRSDGCLGLKDALGGISTDQFAALPPAALGGLKSENLGGIPADVVA